MIFGLQCLVAARRTGKERQRRDVPDILRFGRDIARSCVVSVGPHFASARSDSTAGATTLMQ